MYKILTLNSISVSGLERLPRDRYEIASEIQHPDAVLLRSFAMHEWPIPASLKAVGRAGAGVNNIPVPQMTAKGICVFNAPGANANAVKELVLAGMLLAARNICPAWDYTRKLQGSDAELSKQVEAGKKNFVGIELPNRTLGVIGLGAIGVKVANAARALGMRVIGYDPHITVSNAWQLSSQVEQVLSVNEMAAQADFVTLHVPLNDATRQLINAPLLKNAKPGLILLNFSREGVVDEEALFAALEAGTLKSYVCDFPTNRLKDHPRVIMLPHLGASTGEAEENCAIMVADQVRDYLENGTIHNSVNFPEMVMPRNGGPRLAIVNANVPHMIERISKAISGAGINIMDMLNKSRGDIACTLVDTAASVPEAAVVQIADIEGVLGVRVL
ncbi:MAG: 3-phosphoglycerate dehydrogenase [Candidatus Competibacteraceae bacterium]|nr:3-phosphoglycerate dehydrogenase [Candidatus Competibacteraceae bacterium]MBK7984607.1 3-phosphoglycerate dehydrogenase [Candidatus Competibacteraceae bacterium]MBK8897139.1 3-phosphoglycerate dehydrogenase [Candidatus Competibacteraceae bacterium]MBK8964624.1 3-phosphoglycerate dehydrogenase [Candidatus Competibacteraceae bacterium]MBK9952621.1 3-phosphoglycerate dehydrogenase [Candidatus Competibacteraceae bacterium]